MALALATKGGSAVMGRDNNCNPPMLTAIKCRQPVEFVRKLLDYGGLIKAPLQAAPLKLAVKLEDPAMARLLLDRGADPTPDFGALVEAATQPHPNHLRLLLEHGTNFEPMKLGAAIMHISEGHRQRKPKPAHLGCVSLLIDYGADLTFTVLVGSGRTVGCEVLCSFAEVGNKEAVKVLLDHRVDTNSVRHKGRTALFWAVASSSLDVVDLPIAHGADLNIRDELGETLLSAAIKVIDMMRYLVENGLDVNAANHSGTTPLLQTEDPKVAEYLAQNGADINAECPDLGKTALQKAASKANVELARVLLEQGADVRASPFGELTAMHDAMKSKSLEIVAMLMGHGADPTAVCEKGRFPLIDAVRSAAGIALYIVAEHKVDLHQMFGSTALLHTCLDIALIVELTPD